MRHLLEKPAQPDQHETDPKEAVPIENSIRRQLRDEFVEHFAQSYLDPPRAKPRCRKG
jgi:hypothetical protein